MGILEDMETNEPNSILIVDDNTLDNFFHKELIAKTKSFDTIKDVPCADYAIAHIESLIKQNFSLPSIILFSIDFHNQEDFETIFNYLINREFLGNVRLVCMSPLVHPTFFPEVSAILDRLKVYHKPLVSTCVEEMASLCHINKQKL